MPPQVCNVLVYCRAVRSDLDESYDIAVKMVAAPPPAPPPSLPSQIDPR